MLRLDVIEFIRLAQLISTDFRGGVLGVYYITGCWFAGRYGTELVVDWIVRRKKNKKSDD